MADISDEIIAFLSRQDTYGAERVEVVETHTAMVFLAGERAYKLKKPVRYSYLDYSTPDRRRAACEAEIEINRRFAPSLYLGVEPIKRASDGAFSIDGAGETVDWLVVMRRFDQDRQFDRMAEQGALTPELVRALADTIAEVHGRAPVVQDRGGGAAGLRQAIDITIENLRIAAKTALPARLVEQWIESTLRGLEEQSALLEARRVHRHVRACHGDLHLRNICLFEGRPTLFDAIEFDAALSTTDVLYDLAFLLMDLLHRGLDGYANLVFNRYLDRSDEADGLAALPLFLSVRAAIRSQVTVAQLTHSHEGQPVEGLAEAAREYLSLALKLLLPVGPRLIAIGGLSGTGKSTLAHALAPRIGVAPGARILRSDVLRKRLMGVAPESALPADAYSTAMHGKTYSSLLDEIRQALAAGYSVIADAVFARGLERGQVEELARRINVPFAGIWLEAPVETRAARVSQRVADASDATADIARAQTTVGELPDNWKRIDASLDAGSVAAAAESAILPPR